MAKKAKEWPCAVTVHTKRGAYDAKSGLSLLRAGIGPGESLELRCEGEGELEAGQTLAAYITGKN